MGWTSITCYTRPGLLQSHSCILELCTLAAAYNVILLFLWSTCLARSTWLVSVYRKRFSLQLDILINIACNDYACTRVLTSRPTVSPCTLSRLNSSRSTDIISSGCSLRLLAFSRWRPCAELDRAVRYCAAQGDIVKSGGEVLALICNERFRWSDKSTNISHVPLRAPSDRPVFTHFAPASTGSVCSEESGFEWKNSKVALSSTRWNIASECTAAIKGVVTEHSFPLQFSGYSGRPTHHLTWTTASRANQKVLLAVFLFMIIITTTRELGSSGLYAILFCIAHHAFYYNWWNLFFHWLATTNVLFEFEGNTTPNTTLMT